MKVSVFAWTAVVSGTALAATPSTRRNESMESMSEEMLDDAAWLDAAIPAENVPANGVNRPSRCSAPAEI
jgi:hypothetical protein